MEDFGDILFYIIAAVIGLATTLGRKKKKPAGASVPSESGTIDNSADRMVFDEETGEMEYQVEDEYYIGEESLSEPGNIIADSGESIFSFDPDLEGNYKEPMAEQFDNEGESQLVTEEGKSGMEEVNRNDKNEDVISDFDLRKAVIYSEILKRNDY